MPPVFASTPLETRCPFEVAAGYRFSIAENLLAASCVIEPAGRFAQQPQRIICIQEFSPCRHDGLRTLFERWEKQTRCTRF
jgi:hypothetical protein